MPKSEPGLEELMAAFSHPARPSFLQGDDAARESAFRERITAETSGRHGRTDQAPSSLPTTVSIAQMRGGK